MQILNSRSARLLLTVALCTAVVSVARAGEDLPPDSESGCDMQVNHQGWRGEEYATVHNSSDDYSWQGGDPWTNYGPGYDLTHPHTGNPFEGTWQTETGSGGAIHQECGS